MKVSEVKTLAPKAEAYEFRKDAKYIICFERRTTDKATAATICKALAEVGVSAIGMYADALPNIFALDEPHRPFELKGENDPYYRRIPRLPPAKRRRCN